MVCHGWTVAKYCPPMLVTGRNRLQAAWILDGKLFLITTEIQPSMDEGVDLTCFTGVCGLDGHSQAPRDGFMASRETSVE
ncbi:hypothetical protein GF1_13550 [Desulfolithobacter dissulfuricans]|uniref:Uncharacterized protein n=1 Tax=Desulfolithobacter dissulfuricans TaxID=2795293 RepID=A0A915U0Z4_9BACT|nr:hypothetical protein GF1_13550 [Desulfolithobacter dissulfuricans]